MNKNIFNVWSKIVQEKISSIQFAFLVPNLSVDNDEANQHEFVENSFTPLPFSVPSCKCHDVYFGRTSFKKQYYWLL